MLRQYDPIALEEMNAFALLNRTETKFVMHTDTFLEVLGELSDDYMILEIENKRRNSYRTMYFDSPDLEMYKNHHNGILNRYKIRIREYLNSGQPFLEIKFKDNRRKTIKKRIKTLKVSQDMNPEISSFIESNSSVSPAALKPVLWNKYKRVTMVSKTNVERLTFDMNLEFSDSNYGKSTGLPGIVIAEVKQDAFSNKSDFVKLMQEKSIKNQGFSKYCIGITYLYSNVKKNNFKQKLMYVDKLSRSIC